MGCVFRCIPQLLSSVLSQSELTSALRGECVQGDAELRDGAVDRGEGGTPLLALGSPEPSLMLFKIISSYN